MKVAKFINSLSVQELFSKLYGSCSINCENQTKRYMNLAQAFATHYDFDSVENMRFFSSPGRSEIGGNHTDHNLGCVLAASIQLDCIGVVTQTNDAIISIYDLTYNEDYQIDVTNTQRIASETGSIALVRGIIEGFKRRGFAVGGFKAAFTSDVIAAAGVSSSAAFEMMICMILSTLYNKESISLEQFALIGQFAEHHYWDKKCGLMDQMASAVGGMISIDFANPQNPAIKKIDFNFNKENYDMIILNTGKGHADLSAEYSSIPHEMKDVAQFLGKNELRDISFDDIASNLMQIRSQCGDRAVMRAFHFIEENKRVALQVKSLQDDNFSEFLRLITLSGNSSWKWLQNVYVTENPKEQSIAVCLALTEIFIREKISDIKRLAACRIHGGGFAGVIQVFMPKEYTDSYFSYMNKALNVQEGEKSPLFKMRIRPYGVIEVK
ncbi:MAG: galactokinase [Treponemataceae bacterium]